MLVFQLSLYHRRQFLAQPLQPGRKTTRENVALGFHETSQAQMLLDSLASR
jgi:hypothetical protein